MVNVIFYHLLRSKYNIKQMDVKQGSVHKIIEEILHRVPEMKPSDFETCVVFYEGTPIHHGRFHKEISDGEEIIITHFVVGG